MNFRRFTGIDNRSILEIDVTKIEAIHSCKGHDDKYGTYYEYSTIYVCGNYFKVLESVDKILSMCEVLLGGKK